MVPEEDLFRLLFENHGSVMLLIDPHLGTILRANRAAEQFYGYSSDLLSRMTIFDLNMLPQAQVEEDLVRAVTQPGTPSIFPHKLLNGDVRTVEVYSSPITSRGKDLVFSIIHDITPMQEIQDDLVHKNLLYAVLSQTNQCIVRTRDRLELFNGICDTAVRFGRFKLSWIGLINPETEMVEPVAHAGEASAYLDGIVVSVDPDKVEGQGPTGTACRQGSHYICNDFFADSRTIPWHEQATRTGIASSAAFPLSVEGKIIGAYSLYAAEKNFFTAPLVALLDGIALDISYALDNLERQSQRSRVESAMREAVKRLELATTSGHLGVWDWDVQQNRLVWDDQMFRMYGIQPGSFSATLEGWQDLLHPDDRLGWQAVLQQAVREGDSFDVRFRAKLPDGSIRYIKADGLVIRDATGHATRMIGLNRDVTESSLSEARLQEYGKIIECSSDLVCMLDSGLCYQLANEAFLRYLGLDQGDVSGQTVEKVFGTGNCGQLIHHLKRSILGHTGSFEMMYQFPALGERDLAVSCFPVSDDKGGARVGCIMKDVTERRRFQNQLLHSQKMESIGTLAGGVAHDFNNNLTVIMGYANLIKMIAHEPERVIKMAEEIISSVERATAMTQRLLAFSRKQSLELRGENLNDIIGGLEKSLGRLIGEDIQLTVSLSEEKLFVMVDRGQIEQVLLNLAVNARDAMPLGGRLIISTEWVDMDEDVCFLHDVITPGSYALITVADNGGGIEKGLQKRIFDPFFTTKEVGKGTGLGLSIVYGIIRTHNGFINTYSDPGRGTAFNIYLPITTFKDDAVQPRSEALVPGDETLLLIEDDKAIREMTQLLLEKFGYTVITAEDGVEAIKLFHKNSESISLIITDVIMPGINGREAYDEMVKIKPGIPTIFISGYPADIINRKGFSRKGFNYLAKPLNPALLLKKIRELLSREEIENTSSQEEDP